MAFEELKQRQSVDLAPALIETAQERARERGLDIDYREYLLVLGTRR